MSPLKRIRQQGQVTSPEEQLITSPDFRLRAKTVGARTGNPNRPNCQPPFHGTARTAKPQTPRNRHNWQNRQSRQTQLFYEVVEKQKLPKTPNRQPSLACSSAGSPWVRRVCLCAAAPRSEGSSITPSQHPGRRACPILPRAGNPSSIWTYGPPWEFVSQWRKHVHISVVRVLASAP